MTLPLSEYDRNSGVERCCFFESDEHASPAGGIVTMGESILSVTPRKLGAMNARLSTLSPGTLIEA